MSESARNVVIVGANRGIGLEFVKQYVSSGARVVALCRKASDALRALDCEIIEGVDASDDAIVHNLATQLPVEHIDILIHNAGILKGDSFPDLDFDNMKQHFDVNSLGPLRIILGALTKLGKGSKVGIVSSRVGSIDDNSSSNNYAYRVSKTAVNMVGKCLSIDLKEKGIAVALLHPGYVRTEMTNNSGNIEADEAAAGLIKRMDELSLETSGVFVHSNGESLPW
uniref:SDR family oxidoreductase n=1 Tax=Ningiella ruwaisensis TaxID=2364274 RepID=UPI00109FABAE|nr:SDR family oxidoreductase [Ningiella ruwaisensis]